MALRWEHVWLIIKYFQEAVSYVQREVREE